MKTDQLIYKIFHTTQSGERKAVASLTDEEFEDFLDENGFEVVNSGNKIWSMESRENTLKTMVRLFDEVHNAIGVGRALLDGDGCE